MLRAKLDGQLSFLRVVAGPQEGSGERKGLCALKDWRVLAATHQLQVPTHQLQSELRAKGMVPRRLQEAQRGPDGTPKRQGTQDRAHARAPNLA